MRKCSSSFRLISRPCNRPAQGRLFWAERIVCNTELKKAHQLHKDHIRATLRDQKYFGLDRTWVRKYHSWAGHLGRLGEDRIAKKALKTRSVFWWRREQGKAEGFRHHKTRGNLSRWEATMCRHHPSRECWWQETRDRDKWKKSYPAFEQRVFGESSPHVFEFSENAQDIARQDPQKSRTRKRRAESPEAPVKNKHLKTQNGADKCKGSPGGRQATKDPSRDKTWEEQLLLPLTSLLSPSQDVRFRRAGLGMQQRQCSSNSSNSQSEAGGIRYAK